MTTRLPPPPRDDDFEWPPPAEDLAVYDLGSEPWRGLQEASIEVFAARHGGARQPSPEWSRLAAQRLAGVLVAASIVSAVAGWTLYRAVTATVPAEAGEHVAVPATPKAPAVAAAPTAPPRITIVATYPVEPVATPPLLTASDASLASADATADAVTSIEILPTPAPADATAIAAAAPSPAPLAAPAAIAVPLAAAPAPAVVPARTADASIRDLLQRYEDAYDHRDVQTAAALWPSLDQRALTRAFASLDRQDVSFERCDIDASDARGSAVCVGTVRYVPRVGRSVEKEGRITWTFDLTRAGEDWQIARLSAR